VGFAHSLSLYLIALILYTKFIINASILGKNNYMNQILFPEKFENYIKNDKKTIKLLKLQFIVVIISLIAFLIYFSISYYKAKSNNNLSDVILDSYDITKLYATSTPQYNISLSNGEMASIIGILEIEEISIKYPIFSDITDELLKISPCRFYGPNVNEIGNLCIAGHNYDNDNFFSNIHNLTMNSEIILTDLNNTSIIYKVYNKFETSVDDITSINQNTNGKREITLITCNNLNGNRLIIKAKEKDVS